MSKTRRHDVILRAHAWSCAWERDFAATPRSSGNIVAIFQFSLYELQTHWLTDGSYESHMDSGLADQTLGSVAVTSDQYDSLVAR